MMIVPTKMKDNNNDDDNGIDDINSVKRLIFRLCQTASLLTDNKTTPAISSALAKRPYLIVIQHSRSYLQRHAQIITKTNNITTNNDNDNNDIYRFAGLRTPSENAIRDSQIGTLFLEYFMDQLLYSSSSHPSNDIVTINEDGVVLFVQTQPQLTPKIQEMVYSKQRRRRKIEFINCCQNPFGWDDNDESGNPSSSLLENVSKLISEIEGIISTNCEKSNNCIIIFQSLTPIYLRHGFDTVCQLIQKCQQNQSNNTVPMIVVPIITDFYTMRQNCHFEDMADAVLCCGGGEATLLRQGIRERSNVVREDIPYDIMYESSTTIRSEIAITTRNPILVIHPSSSEKLSANKASTGSSSINSSRDSQPKEETNTTTKASIHDAMEQRPITNNNTIASGPRSGKMKLAFEEDDQQKAASGTPTNHPTAPTAGAPRIYLEDDDPEFEDYDEEDPDEDLDL